MTTALYTHDSSKAHVTPPGHPERVARIAAVEKALAHLDALDRRDCPAGEKADVLRCHPARYVEKVRRALPAEGYASLDADTHVSPGSFEAAMHAVGGMAAAVDAVLSGDIANAFVACRPPGHHAEREKAMGFCLFGTAAIGAMRALDVHGVSRVAVLDFDVHHGNGTQDLLWNEARALFCSSHQMPLYPGSGHVHENGAHDNVINAPLAPMTGTREMRRAWGDEILPAVADFQPDLVIISAGFDAAADDPLANLLWTTDDFAWVTDAILDVADDVAGGRVVSTLEGGYDLPSLGAGVRAHVEKMMERGG